MAAFAAEVTKYVAAYSGALDESGRAMVGATASVNGTSVPDVSGQAIVSPPLTDSV
jgi:hypothetical protein